MEGGRRVHPTQSERKAGIMRCWFATSGGKVGSAGYPSSTNPLHIHSHAFAHKSCHSQHNLRRHRSSRCLCHLNALQQTPPQAYILFWPPLRVDKGGNFSNPLAPFTWLQAEVYDRDWSFPDPCPCNHHRFPPFLPQFFGSLVHVP